MPTPPRPGAPEPGSGAPRVLRSRRRALVVGVLAALAVVNLVLGAVAALAALPVGALLAVQAYAQSRTAVVLADDAAVVRVGLFTRRVVWAEVTDAVPERTLGIERVVLVTPRARYRLPLPSTGPLGSGPAYDEEAAAVAAAWRRGR